MVKAKWHSRVFCMLILVDELLPSAQLSSPPITVYMYIRMYVSPRSCAHQLRWVDPSEETRSPRLYFRFPPFHPLSTSRAKRRNWREVGRDFRQNLLRCSDLSPLGQRVSRECFHCDREVICGVGDFVGDQLDSIDHSTLKFFTYLFRKRAAIFYLFDSRHYFLYFSSFNDFIFLSSLFSSFLSFFSTFCS